MKSIFAFCAIFLFFSVNSLFSLGQFDVTCTGGNWNVTLSAANLTGGAGTDFVSQVESSSDLVNIDVTVTQLNGNWRVDIRRTDVAWNGALSLYARRTTDGTPGGGSGASISGGTTYLQLTTTDQQFFSGRRTRSGIKIQLRLNGLSVNLGQETYRTTINYTLVDP
ncbi:MAG: hypothetical protein JXD23_16645 [Spirochaetales bacterium]|nr:hypothetical protein [Spirochaetales bacterium]